MNRLHTLVFRSTLLLSATLFALGLSQSAFAARDASYEVGRWVGFADQTAPTYHPPNPCSLDLIPGTSRGRALTGMMNGLPAVQTPLRVTGAVTPWGTLSLLLRGEGVRGFCDGSVRFLQNFGRRDGQDDIGEMDYRLVFATGAVSRGHINMVHLYGGMDWRTLVVPDLGAGGDGSVLPPGADELGTASLSIYGFVDPELNRGQIGSQVTGALTLLPAVQTPFQMVGTINERGALVMLAVGMGSPNSQSRAPIGLLFTGAVSIQPGPPSILGHYGTAGFGRLLPAVQRIREGAMSFNSR